MTRRPLLAAIAAAAAVRPTRAQDAKPLAGQTIELHIAAPAATPATRIAAEMAPAFAAMAEQRYGYKATIVFDIEPTATRYDKLTAALAAKSPEPTLLVIDNEWLDSLAAPKWILALNQTIQANPELEIEWHVPAIRSAHQLSPDGSNNRWAMPQSGDVLALFIRRDRLAAPGQAEAYKTKYGLDLPQTWEDFEKLDWADYSKIIQFFTRPDDGYYGLGSHWTAQEHALPTASASFIYGTGGELWQPKGGQVEGILDTDANAAAIAAYKTLLDYQPPDARRYGIDELTAAFTQGKLFSALQWIGAGPDMIPSDLRDQVLVVPPPAFKTPDGTRARRYVIGGQSWAINAQAGDPHRQVATDFLKWWFAPETALDLARRGGNPTDKATLARDDFDTIQPWFRTYRAMLACTAELWHDPSFQDLLAIQQEALTAIIAGTAPPKHALTVAACRQQKLLFQQGTAERQPSANCQSLNL